MLDGLEDGQHARLVVHRTAPPDVAARERTGKRRIAPALVVGGNHVHVRQQQHRLERTVCAFPGVEQAVAADDFSRELFADMREGLMEKVMKPRELVEGGLRRIVVRNRAKLDRAREPLEGRGAIEAHLDGGRRRDLP